MSACVPFRTGFFLILIAFVCNVANAIESESLNTLCQSDQTYEMGLCDGIIIGVLQGAYRGVYMGGVKRGDDPRTIDFKAAVPVCVSSALPQAEVVSTIKAYIAGAHRDRKKLGGPSLILRGYKARFPCRSGGQSSGLPLPRQQPQVRERYPISGYREHRNP